MDERVDLVTEPDSVIDSFAERETCPLCLKPRGNAPIEHVPPQSLNNKRPVRAFELMRLINDETYEGVELRRGHGYFSLCHECNTVRGRRYVPSFSQWEQAAGDERSLAGCRIQGDFYLLRLIKGILMMFMSANTDLDEHGELREFIIDGNRTGLPEPYRLYAFSRQGAFQRATGTLGILKFQEVYFHSEVHTENVGYVLSLNSEVLSPSFTDISHFADYGYKELVHIDLRLQPLVVDTAYPFDYRNKLMIARGHQAPSVLFGLSGAVSRVFVDAKKFAGMLTDFKDALNQAKPEGQ